MKISTLIIGAVGGYAAARALEANASGVPLNIAFQLSNVLKPIVAVKGLLPGAVVAQGTTTQAQVIDVTPLPVG